MPKTPTIPAVNVSKETSTERALGCLLGLAVGDALFAPCEFMSPETIIGTYGAPLREMVGGGWLNVTPGQHTDDTDMALCLARSMASYGSYYPQGALNNYVAWYQGGPIDVGGTTAAALSSALRVENDVELTTKAAQKYHQRSGGRSGGNGSIMRIAPLAIAYGKDPEALIAAAREDAALTHYEPLGQDACALYCLYLAHLIYGTEVPSLEVDELVLAAFTATAEQAERNVNHAIGFVLTALSVARASELVPVAEGDNEFEERLVWAGNLGGDTDTDGAVAGALLGAAYGAQAIPERWLEVLDARHELEDLAPVLSAIADR
jgi:ADP-ribosyl-[dinitrogen reductase] hydrolase